MQDKTSSKGSLSCRKVGTYRVVSTSRVVCVSLDAVARLQVVIAKAVSGRLVVVAEFASVAGTVVFV